MKQFLISDRDVAAIDHAEEFIRQFLMGMKNETPAFREQARDALIGLRAINPLPQVSPLVGRTWLGPEFDGPGSAA